MLTPVNIVTRETEIRKIKVQGRLAQANSSLDPISKISNTKPGW
jgi:hypothetical protein